MCHLDTYTENSESNKDLSRSHNLTRPHQSSVSHLHSFAIDFITHDIWHLPTWWLWFLWRVSSTVMSAAARLERTQLQPSPRPGYTRGGGHGGIWCLRCKWLETESLQSTLMLIVDVSFTVCGDTITSGDLWPSLLRGHRSTTSLLSLLQYTPDC